MNLIDKEVMHKSFGKGSIVDQDGEFITINFDKETKKFVFPDAFGKFLKLKDETANATLKKEIVKLEERQEQLEKEREEEQAQRHLEQQRMNELKKLLKNHKIHESSQLVFWLDDEAEKERVLSDWEVYVGEIKSGKNKGKPNKPVRLHQNSLVLLTKRTADEDEKERNIVGLYMVEETFIGKYAEDGIIPAHSKFKVQLSKEEAETMLFWNYYINEKYPHRMTWNTGIYRYFNNLWAAQILRDIIDLKQDPAEKELAQEFFAHFCKMNQLDINEIPQPSGALKQ